MTSLLETPGIPSQLSKPLKRLRLAALALFLACLMLDAAILFRSQSEAASTQLELQDIERALAAGEPGVAERLDALSEQRASSNRASRGLMLTSFAAVGTFAVVSFVGLLKSAKVKW